jgi:signal transduction histidine kinase
MFLLSEDNLHESISSFEGLMWFWKGVIATAALLSLVTFIFVRTRLFLYYGILLIGIVLFIGLEIGDYFQFFEVDPRNTIIDIKHLGNILVIYSFPMFVNELSPVRKLHPRLWKWTMFLIIPFVFLFLLVLIDPLKDTILLFIITNYAIYISALIFFMQLVFLSSAAIQKRKNALLLVIIYTIYVAIFFITNSLPNLGIISDESVNVYAILLISSIMEVLTFLILIARETFHIYRERTQLMEQRRNHQRNLLLATVDSQERERNKVGRELHDMVGANMAVIKQKVDKQNKELRNILHHTIEVIRNLSHGLMTPHVKQEEFADEISELCILSSTEKLVVRSYFHNWEGFRINKESATHLYRIVQELLQNAIKHSQANRIYIQFLVEDSKLILMYDDNGIGFGDNSHFRKGIGLMNIESRVKLLNGEIDYNNKPDTEGVSVMMEFPEFQN